MGLFYTGKGDKGISCFGTKKIPKDHAGPKVLGDLDELNSLLGLVRAQAAKKDLSKKLQQVQQDLFIIQANVAWALYPKFKAPALAAAKVRFLEKEIETMERAIRPSRGFVVPGSTTLEAWLDYARAVARRVERAMFSFSKKYRVALEILPYLNRLSSYLYALARLEIYKHKKKEAHPTYK